MGNMAAGFFSSNITGFHVHPCIFALTSTPASFSSDLITAGAFTGRADSVIEGVVGNDHDLTRWVRLLRVRRPRHREGICGKEQEPKHECYGNWITRLPRQVL
jgi:hypothetical protein